MNKQTTESRSSGGVILAQPPPTAINIDPTLNCRRRRASVAKRFKHPSASQLAQIWTHKRVKSILLALD